MALSIRELSKDGQETFEYLDAMPAYAQGFVTDCIANTGSIFAAADMFDTGILAYLKEYRLEHYDEFVAELDDLSQQSLLNYDGKNPLTAGEARAERIGA